MNKEQRFYKALQDVFIGAKIEGQGGFVNLMRIKSNYYSRIEQILKKDIEEALQKYPSFRDELFDKLYSFFSRYFTESGSIYFNSTPFHNSVYEKVYTDDKDVILFWKTQMLYYVKTDKIFRSLPIEFDGLKFYFNASEIENKKANEKRSLVFELDKVRDDRTIVFNVHYSEKGTKTKDEEILQALKRKGIAITEEQLERAFRIFEKQSEVDFFINKNAKAFLQEQFKLWSYQYFWEGAKEWSADRVNQLQILKNIAYKIIDFIAQFEDELVKIWNKPKFVKNSNYVITLDRIKDTKLIEKILKHKNIEEQIKEWQELGIVDNTFNVKDVFETKLNGKSLSEKYKHLPIDTKYFKDLELEILNQFDDLDKALDGWLIKSENYQALNTILPKFKEKVQTIYIDPPYNTGSDEFVYKDRFQHASWLSMMENRLILARELMREDGVIFVNIGEEEIYNLSNLLINVFEENNYLGNFIWRKRAGGGNDSKYIALEHDYITIVSKNITKLNMGTLQRDLSKYEKDKHGYYLIKPLYEPTLQDSPGLHYDIVCPDGKILSGKVYQWKVSEKTFKKLLEKSAIIFQKNNKGKWVVKYKHYINVEKGLLPASILYKVAMNKDATQEMKSFSFEIGIIKDLRSKPTALIKYLVQISSQKESIVLDFFAGSGTTAHAVMKLNKEDGGKRKFILVEMADYFETVIIPRIKKIAYSFNWEEGKPQNADGIGIFFKYYELEQYEEALAKCKYEDSDMLNIPSDNPYQEYVFMKDEKMLKALDIDYENNKVKVDLSKLYPNIDIAETLSNLTGKWIKRISSDEVEFQDGTKINIKDLDYKLIKPLIWWE